MSTSLSQALKTQIASGTSLVNAFTGGQLFLYGDTRAADADTAPGASPLVTITDTGLPWTDATRATAVLVFAGASGSVDSIKVGGAAQNLMGGVVGYSVSLATTVNNVAAAINTNANPFGISAVSDGVNTVTLYLPHWMGANGNGLTVAVTTTTLTYTINGAGDDWFGAAGGVATVGVAADKGLLFDPPATVGVLSKLASQTWKGFAAGNGTLKWFRLVAAGSVPTSTGAANVRLDGSVGTELTATPSAVVLTDAPCTLTTFSVSVISVA
jgi:hypothetical protein